MQAGRQSMTVAVVVLALACSGLRATSVKPPASTTVDKEGKPVKLAETCPAYFVNTTAFLIPFVVARDRVEAASVILYVSTDRGRTYQKVMKATPGKGRFEYHSAGDGIYLFAVQIVHPDGQLDPPTMKEAVPSMIVEVDTKAPVVKLEATREEGHGIYVKWRVEDESLFLQTLQIDLRSQGGNWGRIYSLADSALERKQIRTREEGEVGFNLANKEGVEVRLRVEDLAGNCAEKVVTLKARK